MSKYILLLNWTEQGVKSVRESPRRFEAAKETASEIGCTLETIYMTFGPYDLVAMLDAPSDDAAATFVLRTTSAGNIRATTLKAFVEDDYRRLTAAA